MDTNVLSVYSVIKGDILVRRYFYTKNIYTIRLYFLNKVLMQVFTNKYLEYFCDLLIIEKTELSRLL